MKYKNNVFMNNWLGDIVKLLGRKIESSNGSENIDSREIYREDLARRKKSEVRITFEAKQRGA